MVLPSSGESPYFAPSTGPGVGLVQYRLIFADEMPMLENIMAALVTLCDPSFWNASDSIQLDAYLNAARGAVESFTEMRTVGTVTWFAGDPSNIPVGSLHCDGSALARVDYPLLFEAIGIEWGAPTPDEFNIPDLRGRSIMGQGSGPGLTTRFAGTLIGEENHVLTENELASHTHIDAGHTHVVSEAGPNLTTIGPGAPEPTALPVPAVTGIGNANLSTTGLNSGHNTVHPVGVLTAIIWYI